MLDEPVGCCPCPCIGWCLEDGSAWAHDVLASAVAVAVLLVVYSSIGTKLGCANGAALPLADLAKVRSSSMKYPSQWISSLADDWKGPACVRHAVIGGGSTVMAPARGSSR